jgi:tetratricopeptide (TPR) repeat protein
MAYKYKGDTLKCEACLVAEERAGHYQFSREYQEALDRSLAIDSTFDYGYKAKSTAYLKSGDFITWKQLMDEAVRLNPKDNLDYRGWCRYQFFRDYQGAIDDIEALDAMVDYDIGACQNGDYHLQIARALCYKALGNPDLAIEIIEGQLAEESYYIGLYDYLHLGVLYLERGEPERALALFELQEGQYNWAENAYYQSIAYSQLGDSVKAKSYMVKAYELYISEINIVDVYTRHDDKIYLEDIEQVLAGFE